MFQRRTASTYVFIPSICLLHLTEIQVKTTQDRDHLRLVGNTS